MSDILDLVKEHTQFHYENMPMQYTDSAPDNFFLNQYGTGQNLSQSVSGFRLQYLSICPRKDVLSPTL